MARAPRLVELDNKPPCEVADLLNAALDVLREQNAEMRKLRMTMRAGIRQVQPACNAVRGLCTWIKKWGPWLLGSIPIVLTSVGAISPQVAKGLAELIKALGAG